MLKRLAILWPEFLLAGIALAALLAFVATAPAQGVPSPAAPRSPEAIAAARAQVFAGTQAACPVGGCGVAMHARSSTHATPFRSVARSVVHVGHHQPVRRALGALLPLRRRCG